MAENAGVSSTHQGDQRSGEGPGLGPAAIGRGRLARILINRNYARLWAGAAASDLGTVVFDTTVVLWVATIIARGRPWGPLAVSGVVLAAAVPVLVLGPIAGVFVDRWDKRRTMLRCDLLSAVLAVGLLPVALAGDRVPTWAALTAIYATVFLINAVARFFSPARMTLIGDVVPRPDQPRASGLSQTAYNTAFVVGPPLAAPLLFAFGTEWALVINAASFLASFAVIRRIQPPATAVGPPAGHSFGREFGDGLRFFLGNRTLLTLLITAVLVTAGGGALNALDVFFVTENLHVDPSRYGLLGMTFGAGAIAGGVLASIFSARIGLVRTLSVSLATAGAGLLWYSRQTALAPTLVILAVIGVATAGVNAALGPIVLQCTPRQYVGRVMAVITPVITLASILSVSVAGLVAGTLPPDFHATVAGVRVGRIDLIFMVAGLLVLLGAGYALLNVRLPAPAADAIRPPDAAAPPEPAGVR